MSYENLTLPVDQLTPNPWNSNHLTPDAEEKLDASITRFGFVKPVIVRTLEDGTKQILGGEHRWHSAIRLGLKEIPVFDLGVVTDERAKEVGLIDNARYGMDDAGELAEILKSLGDNDELASFLPYTTKELDAIFMTSKVDLKELGMEDSSDEINLSDDLPEMTPTHQLMRFKVQREDCEWVADLLDFIMKSQGYKDGDSLTNAGDALVFALRKAHETLSKDGDDSLDEEIDEDSDELNDELDELDELELEDE